MAKKEIKDEKIIQSVRQLFELAQTKSKNNVFEKSNELNISRKDLETIITIVDASIMQAFALGISNTVKDIKR